ncbi:FAD-dependent monooxygenase [Solimicrobium silvestre]|uniref:Ubi-OHases: ubiquinone biosynthesis hydroxylase, UbiH/UbiF/VisC/COQ6 family n=1 Tax=Solimicrobium silvestre TaxID=2099400 RepID=A0A2S9H190_9BURK|nr:FAD-dependent monooxygenase [Solimicrobium silvestre]PRC93752.1 Ubi-OHases: ubiquinone biosynthesis hydroxylase, UbiH/UbiF/VisC/COQ6 family [Solimicrobium silvestre]
MMPKFDIAICGAGPVGQTLALLLIKRGIPASNLVLIDAKTQEQAAADQRTIALSYGSQQILQAASAWPIKATEIHQIHVSRRGHFGRTVIDCKDQKVPALGYVARYANILQPLTTALNQHPELTFLRPAKVSTITQTENHAQIILEDQRIIDAKIVVQAEGGLFGEQAPQIRHHDYQQTALIAHVTTSSPIAARAFERFTEQGPLALLPQEDGYALVWCVRPEHAARLIILSDAAFLAELQTTFGERLGRFISSSPRSAFPLGLNAQTSAPTGRTISIGNAAQTLHPVAGQGLNLGLRDAFQLAQFLSKSTAPTALQDFFQTRLADRNSTIHLTDQMAQVFASAPDGSAKQTLLGAGLGLIDLFAPAQHWLAQQMMFGRR